MCRKLQSILFRKITIIFFLNLTIFSFAQCKTTEKSTPQDELPTASIKSIVSDTTASKFNSDKSMELHVKKTSKQGDPAFHLEYTVYNTKTKAIVKQGSFRGTAIDWNDNTSLKLTPYVGMEQKPSSDNPEEVLGNNTHTQLIIIINLNN